MFSILLALLYKHFRYLSGNSTPSLRTLLRLPYGLPIKVKLHPSRECNLSYHISLAPVFPFWVTSPPFLPRFPLPPYCKTFWSSLTLSTRTFFFYLYHLTDLCLLLALMERCQFTSARNLAWLVTGICIPPKIVTGYENICFAIEKPD